MTFVQVPLPVQLIVLFFILGNVVIVTYSVYLSSYIKLNFISQHYIMYIYIYADNIFNSIAMWWSHGHLPMTPKHSEMSYAVLTEIY